MINIEIKKINDYIEKNYSCVVENIMIHDHKVEFIVRSLKCSQFARYIIRKEQIELAVVVNVPFEICVNLARKIFKKVENYGGNRW